GMGFPPAGMGVPPGPPLAGAGAPVGGRRVDPVPAVLFAMLPIGTAAGVEIGQRMMSDVADLVAGSGAPELVERIRDGVASTLIVTVVALVAAVAVAVFL